MMTKSRMAVKTIQNANDGIAGNKQVRHRPHALDIRADIHHHRGKTEQDHPIQNTHFG